MTATQTYERTLKIANLILFTDEYNSGTLPEPRCSRCGNGVPVCADFPGEDRAYWHSWACIGFQPDMPVCWVCEGELRAEYPPVVDVELPTVGL